jgi:pSer/pThr/pTyr-binding forkhead associated (FHA) protein
VDLDAAILVLRVVAVGFLYLLLLGVVIVVWRDWKSTARYVERTRQDATRSLGRLVVVRRGQTELLPGQAIPLSVITGLGRAPSNTVVLSEPFASNEHARLYRRDGRWWLEDLGSRNGTLLNGERLHARAIVATGDLLGIGSVQLRIELEEG